MNLEKYRFSRGATVDFKRHCCGFDFQSREEITTHIQEITQHTQEITIHYKKRWKKLFIGSELFTIINI